MKKIAVAYCRVSTEGQLGEDKFGLDYQEELIKEFAAKNGYEITDWFYDKGVSGAAKDRPALGRLLEGAVTNPPVEYVIVAKADRIARDVELYYTFKGMMKERNLTLISVTEDWSNGDKLTGMIIENVFAMMAEIERANIKYRTSGGRKEKAKMGGYAGGRVPYGYTAVNHQLVVNPEEAKIVKRIFFMKDKMGRTYPEIAEVLKSEGVKTHWGKEFLSTTVRIIYLNRKTYEGYYKYGDGTWVKGQQEAILPESDVSDSEKTEI